MEIRKVQVIDNTDFTEMGTVKVKDTFTGLTRKHEPYCVIYTSPYYAHNEGGIIAIPEVGVMILICKPDNDDNWFYMSSVVAPNPGMAKVSDKGALIKGRKIIHSDEIYRARSRPEALAFSSSEGNELNLKDSHNPGYFNSQVQLKSSAGKQIAAIDSPQIDAVIIRNEHDDYLKISSNANGSMGPRSIELECQGNMRLNCREANLDISVEDGRELNIHNNSTGSHRISSNDSSPGNINIKTDWGDVNITVQKAENGSIFLTVKGDSSHIVLQSEGSIEIAGKKGVNIQSEEGDVVIQGKTIQLN